MSKLVRKSTRDPRRIYPARGARTFQPTGQWDVPKYDGLTRDAVAQFFHRHCNPGNDDQCVVYVHDMADNRFLVYLDGHYQYPSSDARFLDGTLIKQWHMTTSAYWNTMRVYDENFRAFATHHTDDPPPTLHIQNGVRRYPGEGDERLAGLPRAARIEAFHMKIQSMHALVVRVTLSRSHYHTYIRELVNSHTNVGMPLITATVQLDSERLRITLRYTGPEWITGCATMSPTETGLITFAFYTE